ncbi:efflux RND transporter periplasmic adaptor subunit [candidate division KSB1 bacterium]|nr:efflux RND transporter periplasmic adaptor subunit [candidate division KSB1 bacterium]
MSKKKIIIGSVILVVIAVMVIYVLNKNSNKEVTTVQTEKVKPVKIVETVTATGRIQPETQVKISADVASKITQLPVKEGDWVERGTLLVKLDRERYFAAVESAQASLRSAESNATLAKENKLKAQKDYDRIKELFARNLESQANLDQAYAGIQIETARYNSALEDVEQAKAALKQANDSLSKTEIYAPMAGTISELNKEVGEIALGSQFQEDVIMVLSNLAGMEAQVKVDENDIVTVSIGDSARIEVDALPNKVFHGIVSEIASSATISGAGTTDQKTEFEVKISIIDAGTDLKPGMTASSDIITEIKTAVIGVPIQCVTVRTLEQLQKKNSIPDEKETKTDTTTGTTYVPDKDGFVPVVFLLKEGIVTARQVKTGIQSDTHIEVLEGIAEGDEIITGSYRAISQTLRNDMTVSVQNQGPK